MLIKTIENLNNKSDKDKIKYEFKNQRMSKLAMEYLDNKFGSIPLSTMNKSGDFIFHSEFIRNCQFNGWISAPKKEKLNAYDYNKHYTSCFIGQDVKFGWPIYTVFDEVKPFEGDITTGFYYIETDNFFPLKGNGFYDADLIQYCIDECIIKENQIKYEYKSSHELKPKHFKTFVEAVYNNFENPKYAINTLIGFFGHDYKSRNVHHFTQDGRLVLPELVQNSDAKVKYVYHKEFTESKTEPINIDDCNIDDYVSTKNPLMYHVYDDKRVKSFKNSLPLFYKVYNVSAMKMHQMTKLIGGTVRAVFTDTIIFEGKINQPKCNTNIIGGIRKTKLKEFTHCCNTKPRETKYEELKPEPIKLKSIEEFNINDNLGCFITGMAGTGKSYKTKQLQQELLKSSNNGNCFRVCTPTHKSALIVDGITVYNLFNINPHDFSYLKSSVEKLKNEGLEWVFIDEISMISSKVWSVLRDIKRIYKFKFVLVGDFAQLDPVEEKKYNVLHSEIFAELCDGQMLELTRNYRAENDPVFKEFSDDLLIARNGGKPNFNKYGKTECRKSLCWTNKTRKEINYKWMLEESKDKPYIIINNVKVFCGLPIICKKTFKCDKVNELKNNEEFEVINISDKDISIKNNR